MPLYVDVALAVPSSKSFQYSVPDDLASKMSPGLRVFVRMRNRRMAGTVVGISSVKIVEEIKPIEKVIHDHPVLDDAMLQLAEWMSQYYLCSIGQVIDAMLPAAFRKGKHFMKSRSASSGHTHEIDSPHDLPLTQAQQKAYDTILSNIHSKRSGIFLLHGITGSGKTEVYIQLIRKALEQGRSSIVLVPEISLTPQAVNRFYSRFGDCVAVIHSRLSGGKRVEEWHRIQSGQAKVVIGARSALFSPVQNLGLIVIDEEHEGSYKQEEAPRYHAREVAKKRIELENAVLVMGSATPSLETFYACRKGGAACLDLPQRIESRPLPAVEIVDMRRQQEGKKERIFSTLLEQAIRDTLFKKEQVMLLLNRRGFSTYLHCSSCGYVMTCPNCRISLAYHFDKSMLLCHVCHYQCFPQKLCPGCQKNYLHYFGVGTQKVEQDALRLFPEAKLGRMDADSTSRKDSHENILKAFKKKEIDILIGTQMIAKGHDFPNVSLIGVISADTALHIPDFRSSEKTFDLLTQVAGRAGRGDIPGKVLIQTFVPHHYSIQSAKEHDFHGFYEKEIIFRRELSMPPFTHLVRVIVRGVSEKEVVRQILTLAKELRQKAGDGPIHVSGPAPCLVSKEHSQYHWNLMLKGPDQAAVSVFLKSVLDSFKKTKVVIAVDVDPV